MSAPERIRIDPEYDGWNEQVIGWAVGNLVEDMADWPEYVHAETVATLIAQARAEALEEAAVIAETFRDEMFMNPLDRTFKIPLPAAIRARKDEA